MIVDPYRDSLLKTLSSLEKSQEVLSAPGVLDPSREDFPLTTGILQRLRAYYCLQHEIKRVYEKRIGNDGADFFTETVASFIKAALAQRKDLKVLSEEKLTKQRGKLRPDISIWLGDIPIAAVECKTQMGWSRSRWERSFLSRESSLREDFPDLKVYHVVMTGVNWPGLPPGHPNTGKKWFTLSKGWPGPGYPENPAKEILNPIEPLVLEILK